MIDIRTKRDLKDFPILNNGEVFIYVIENEEEKIKIGKTTNINQRYQALCGSNSQGINIIRVFVSDATNLYTLENIMHEIFKNYRIPNTEWFKGISFKEVVMKLLSLFSSDSYKLCNEERRKFNENKTKAKEKKDENNK